MATNRMPVIFLAHGAPYFMDDNGEMIGPDALLSAGPGSGEAVSVEQTSPLGLTNLFSELHEWANDLPRPKSVLMLSAHWEARPLTIGATRTVPLIYDFYGFPEPFRGCAEGGALCRESEGVPQKYLNNSFYFLLVWE